MKLHNVVQNEAVLSNVGTVSSFTIKATAKSFRILSDGLYANKVRAIIRELSCNAYDSHIAAGKKNTPFDVHLPNALEPWFSIRDYGTGLSHNQVTNIFTTFFESTKTDSNDYVGALGLGSKSPFSYTDNFTVTAIKDGRKGIYTAFINEQGVPSIALMMEEDTTDPAGVEVRFAVNERYDFEKFRTEARYVYEYFKLRPVVSGSADFQFKDPVYFEKDIIPGVHQADSGRHSVAVMGNIKYPIDVPNAEKALGDFTRMLSCGLVMEFNIGELDFQASREGLSYIPETITAIKNKLEALNTQLAVHVAVEADKITNLWERAYYLNKHYNEPLWTQAVKKYIADTKFELIKNSNSHCYVHSMHMFSMSAADLRSDCNIVIRAFSRTRGYNACHTITPRRVVNTTSVGVFHDMWDIDVNEGVEFVINDTKVGATERAKYHWRNSKQEHHSVYVYVIDAADKTKPINTKKFFKALSNPPEKQIRMASTLLEKDRAKGMGKNVSIMALVEGQSRNWRNERPMVWNDAGNASSFDQNTTYYYLPLSGYQNLGVMSDVKELHQHLRQSGLFTGTIYGVRKADIEWVKTQKNWVNLDSHIKVKLSQLGQNDVLGLVKRSIDWKDLYVYNATSKVTNPNSPYLKLFNEFKDVVADEPTKRRSLETLCRAYWVQTQSNLDPAALLDKYRNEVVNLYKRYPLLKKLSNYNVSGEEVAEYINLIDEKKGV